jgi:DNA-binding NtrC family response regulator
MTTPILMVDDDRFFCHMVRSELGREGLEVEVEHTLEDARELAMKLAPGVVLLDNRLPDGNGLSLVPDVLRANDGAKVILITGAPSFDNAVHALRDGVHDYLTKPVDLEQLQMAVRRALRTHRLEQAEEVEHRRSAEDRERSTLVGVSPAWREIEGLARRFAATNVPVLITGESGTGKSLLARSIHYASPRSDRPFLSANCAALPETLVEAELFGVEKGAFTGATATRKGLFEIADGGSLFLDEVAEMPPGLQSKLLGVLDDGRVRRLGAAVMHRTSTRVLAATNVDPERAMTEGTLRVDLYYRLNVLRLHVPPLRERSEDVPVLAAHLLARLAPGRAVRLGPGEDRILSAYPWPGNVRELKNVLERALILEDGPLLRPSRLLAGASPSALSNPSAVPEEETLEEVERRHILAAFERAGGSLTRSAGRLGISISTLRRKLQGYARDGRSVLRLDVPN